MTRHWSAATLSLGLAVVPTALPHEHWGPALVPIGMREVGAGVR